MSQKIYGRNNISGPEGSRFILPIFSLANGHKNSEYYFLGLEKKPGNLS